MTAEQKARDMLERMGYDNAQSRSAGEVVELANLIAGRDALHARPIGMRIAETIAEEIEQRIGFWSGMRVLVERLHTVDDVPVVRLRVMTTSGAMLFEGSAMPLHDGSSVYWEVVMRPPKA